MSFVSIATGIFALAKAVPVVASYIDRFYDLWIDKHIGEIDEVMYEVAKQRKSLMKAISNAQTDEERISLSIVFSKFNRNEL